MRWLWRPWRWWSWAWPHLTRLRFTTLRRKHMFKFKSLTNKLKKKKKADMFALELKKNYLQFTTVTSHTIPCPCISACVKVNWAIWWSHIRCLFTLTGWKSFPVNDRSLGMGYSRCTRTCPLFIVSKYTGLSISSRALKFNSKSERLGTIIRN